MNSNNNQSHITYRPCSRIAHVPVFTFLRFSRFLETGFVCERALSLIVIDDRGSWIVVYCAMSKTDIGSLSPHSVKLCLSLMML